jgi:hypothetical protein
LAPQAPRLLLSGEKPARIPVRLHRTQAEQPAALLFAAWADLAAWAATAALVRLAPLRLAAVRGEGARLGAFIAGTPLPPLPGMRFCREGLLAIPAGWALPLPVAEVERLLGVGAGGIAVLRPADPEAGGPQEVSCTLLAGECFLPLSRAGVRATFAELGGDA